MRQLLYDFVTLTFGFVTLRKRLHFALGGACDSVTVDFQSFTHARTHITQFYYLLSYCHKALRSALSVDSLRDTRIWGKIAKCHCAKKEGGASWA